MALEKPGNSVFNGATSSTALPLEGPEYNSAEAYLILFFLQSHSNWGNLSLYQTTLPPRKTERDSSISFQGI